MIDLNSLIERSFDLEPLPATVGRLAAIIGDEDKGIADIVEVVSLDPPLTARLLRVANSAASATRYPITTVHAAIGRLGGGAVLSLATGAAVKKRLQQSCPELGLSEGALWRHSVAAALAVEESTAFCKVSLPAGIVHGGAAAARHRPARAHALLECGRAASAAALARGGAHAATARRERDPGCAPRRGRGPHRAAVELPEVIRLGMHHHNPSDAPWRSGDVVHLAETVADAPARGSR
ncbi:MAG: HDOD domain-containing protein [Planctomycetota bacterium]